MLLHHQLIEHMTAQNILAAAAVAAFFASIFYGRRTSKHNREALTEQKRFNKEHLDEIMDFHRRSVLPILTHTADIDHINNKIIIHLSNVGIGPLIFSSIKFNSKDNEYKDIKSMVIEFFTKNKMTLPYIDAHSFGAIGPQKDILLLEVRFQNNLDLQSLIDFLCDAKLNIVYTDIYQKAETSYDTTIVDKEFRL